MLVNLFLCFACTNSYGMNSNDIIALSFGWNVSTSGLTLNKIDMIDSSSSYPSYLLYSSTPNHPNAPIMLYLHRHCAVQL